MSKQLRQCTILLLLFVAPSVAASATPRRVRIAVLGLFHSNQLVVEASPASPLLVDSGQQEIVAGAGARQSVAIRRLGSNVVVEAAGSRIVGKRFTFGPRSGGEAEFVLAIPGKLRRRYRGNLIVTAGKAELIAVVEMELETAVASIVAAELSPEAPLEALKAQAVVSRSFLASAGRRHPYADFCDTTHCQFLREPPPAASRAALAVRATSGLVLAWKGKPFAAMYSASCGGRTRSLAQVGAPAPDYPYFSVECAYCRRKPEKWSSQLSKKDASALAPGSEQERIHSARKLGWGTLPSNTFTESDAPGDDAAGDVVLNGVGRGHGVGLCQRGASGMAQNGEDFRAILLHYFPNTTVESIPASD
jgi:stage II sporulation protein D